MNAPGELEVYDRYRRHLGPRYEGAGLGIQFHYNQVPGVSFRVEPPEGYRRAILRGIADGMAQRFPDFPVEGGIYIIEISDDEIDSSERAFYRAARMVIDRVCPVGKRSDLSMRSREPRPLYAGLQDDFRIPDGTPMICCAE